MNLLSIQNKTGRLLIIYGGISFKYGLRLLYLLPNMLTYILILSYPSLSNILEVCEKTIAKRDKIAFMRVYHGASGDTTFNPVTSLRFFFNL